jgi:hypothetical protein
MICITYKFIIQYHNYKFLKDKNGHKSIENRNIVMLSLNNSTDSSFIRNLITQYNEEKYVKDKSLTWF